MEGENKIKERSSDHDVLLRLDVRFSDFMDKSWPELLERLSKLLDRIDSKADKVELQALREKVNKNASDIAVLQNTHQDDKVRKDTLLTVGKIGWKGWVAVTSIIITLLTIVGMLSSTA